MNIEGGDRGRLDGVPETGPASPPPETTRATPPAAQSASSFEFNNPTVVSLLYLSSFILGFTAIVGVVLAYVWRGNVTEDWEASHYQYLINTFWIGFVGGVISVMLMIVLIGFLLLPAVAVLVIVRSVLSLIKAQKREPMPNPSTLLA